MNAMLFAPEMVLILGSLAVFAVSLKEGQGRLAAALTLGAGLGAMGLAAFTMGGCGDLFSGAFRVDAFSQLFKVFIALGGVGVTVFGRDLKDIRSDVRPEYFLFLLLGMLGLMVLVSSVELITLFVALELSSYALYLLVPMRQERTGFRLQMEAAAKYVMFGIVSTAFLLFGLSYLYGMTGSTYFRDLAPWLAQRWSDPAAVVGIAFVLAGLFFKLAAFPMHLWAPDVYQGASNETTAFIAGVPKLGAVAVLIRFLMCAEAGDRAVTTILLIVSVGSMFLGNLAALVQKDLKRMLGYSSIAHAGYVLLGLVTMEAGGYAAATFYILAFVVMSMGAFLVICQMSHAGENLTVDDLAGLHRRAPLAALIMGVSMFALAGIPPFAGFMGKFFLMAEALRHGFTMLVVLAAVNTAIGVYYYLTVVRVMYFGDPGERPAPRLTGGSVVLSVVLLALMLGLGVVPARLLDAALAAVQSLAL